MNSLFISDLHLSPQTPELAYHFLNFLDHTATESSSLYILGDLFEVWLGDDAISPELAPLLQSIRALSDAGTEVYFMHGNRDFLIADQFQEHTGCRILQDPTVIDLLGQPTLLMHGDLLCTDDVDYQAFRRQVRDPAWQKHFLSLSINERIALAKQARDQSTQQTQSKRDEIMDTNQQAVEKTMREYQVQRLIHGHTHRPAVHRFTLDGKPAERIVLGDWVSEPSMLVINENSYQLLDPRVTDQKTT